MARLPVKRAEPRMGLARLHDEMDDLLGSFFEGWDIPFWGRTRWPAIDVTEKENDYLVQAEVPGCKAEDIDISVCGNLLTLSGEKKQEKEEKEKGYYHAERCYGSFRRELRLPSDVDAEKVEAKCKEGILTIKLPKSEKSKAKHIEVKG